MSMLVAELITRRRWLMLIMIRDLEIYEGIFIRSSAGKICSREEEK